MSDDYLSGRLARFAEVARQLDPHMRPVRITGRERLRLLFWLWRRP